MFLLLFFLLLSFFLSSSFFLSFSFFFPFFFSVRSHRAISLNHNPNLRGWANLRSRPTILFNQNQYPVCGWANLRSRPAIPFNQNQIQKHVCGLIMTGDLPEWEKERVVSLLWVTYPGGRMASLLWVTYPGKKR